MTLLTFYVWFSSSSAVRCEVLSLRVYSESAISLLLRYPSSLPDAPGHALAQLPMEGVVSLPLTTVATTDDISRVLSCNAGNDVGPSLCPVLSLGHFKAGSLTVTGSRQLAAVLSWNGKKVRLFDVDADEEIEEEEEEEDL